MKDDSRRGMVCTEEIPSDDSALDGSISALVLRGETGSGQDNVELTE
jgi:hypothetical protein